MKKYVVYLVIAFQILGVSNAYAQTISTIPLCSPFTTTCELPQPVLAQPGIVLFSSTPVTAAIAESPIIPSNLVANGDIDVPFALLAIRPLYDGFLYSVDLAIEEPKDGQIIKNIRIYSGDKLVGTADSLYLKNTDYLGSYYSATVKLNSLPLKGATKTDFKIVADTIPGKTGKVRIGISSWSLDQHNGNPKQAVYGNPMQIVDTQGVHVSNAQLTGVSTDSYDKFLSTGGDVVLSVSFTNSNSTNQYISKDATLALVGYLDVASPGAVTSIGYKELPTAILGDTPDAYLIQTGRVFKFKFHIDNANGLDDTKIVRFSKIYITDATGSIHTFIPINYLYSIKFQNKEDLPPAASTPKVPASPFESHFFPDLPVNILSWAEPGTTYTVDWSGGNPNILRYDVALSGDSFGMISLGQTHRNGDGGSFTWTVPTNISPTKAQLLFINEKTIEKSEPFYIGTVPQFGIALPQSITSGDSDTVVITPLNNVKNIKVYSTAVQVFCFPSTSVMLNGKDICNTKTTISSTENTKWQLTFNNSGSTPANIQLQEEINADSPYLLTQVYHPDILPASGDKIKAASTIVPKVVVKEANLTSTIETLYKILLGHSPDQTSLDYYANSSLSLTDIVISLLNSAEYKTAHTPAVNPVPVVPPPPVLPLVTPILSSTPIPYVTPVLWPSVSPSLSPSPSYSPNPSPTPTVTHTPSPSPSPTVTIKPSVTPNPTPTPTPYHTPSPSPYYSPSPSPSPRPSVNISPSVSPSSSPRASADSSVSNTASVLNMLIHYFNALGL